MSEYFFSTFTFSLITTKVQIDNNGYSFYKLFTKESILAHYVLVVKWLTIKMFFNIRFGFSTLIEFSTLFNFFTFT